MSRYKLTIEYDGSCFYGFQRQENFFSVQELIEQSIFQMTHEKVTLMGAGRTDTGVHAKGQVGHVDIEKNISPHRLKEGLNFFMQEKGATIADAEIVDNTFHARFSAKERVYQYHIFNRSSPCVFEINRSWHIKKTLDLLKMQEAASYFLGTQNFKAFRCSHCQSKTTIKTMNLCTVEKTTDHHIVINIRSKSFLHNQVRIMVGTLVDIGLLRFDPTHIKTLLLDGKREGGGQTAPAHGLYFMEVVY
ncbi:MAG: tRNA pseudouridine(38-40) synthase TruA [Proteobacteria bacterium]|nr:tRNA pseudouridine(38-40) synthase TruA [Pseudomonadota bacterium]